MFETKSTQTAANVENTKTDGCIKLWAIQSLCLTNEASVGLHLKTRNVKPFRSIIRTKSHQWNGKAGLFHLEKTEAEVKNYGHHNASNVILTSDKDSAKSWKEW